MPRFFALVSATQRNKSLEVQIDNVKKWVAFEAFAPSATLPLTPTNPFYLKSVNSGWAVGLFFFLGMCFLPAY
jgi:hypothetical protein